MTRKEKAEKFDEIQKWLWTAVRQGNSGQQMLASVMIQVLRIKSPEGDEPEEV